MTLNKKKPVDFSERKLLAEYNLVNMGKCLAKTIQESASKRNLEQVEQAALLTLAAMAELVAVNLNVNEKVTSFVVPGGFEIFENPGSVYLCLLSTDTSLKNIKSCLEKGLAVEARILVPNVKIALAVLEKILPFLDNPLFAARICQPDKESGIACADAHRVTARLAELAMRKGGPKKAARGQLRTYRLYKKCVDAWTRGIVTLVP